MATMCSGPVGKTHFDLKLIQEDVVSPTTAPHQTSMKTDLQNLHHTDCLRVDDVSAAVATEIYSLSVSCHPLVL